MADQKISALTSYTPLINTDVIPVVDVTTGTTKKVTVANLKASIINIYTATATTLSLTTTASQKVIVWAKGDAAFVDNLTFTVTLQYNGVTKDTASLRETNNTGSSTAPFSTMYTETPGAATHNITVVSSSGSATLADVVIIAMVIG